jgi:Secretion system C-terminal sorting domain
MHKRSIYSLLLTSFILVFAYAMSMAQTVTVQSKTELRCVNGSLDISVSPTGDASAFEVVLVVTGNYSSLSAVIDPAVAASMTTIVDLSRVAFGSPDTIRIAGMKTSPGNTCLSGPFPRKVASLSYTTGNVCSGSITVAGGSLPACALNPGVLGTSQFVDCASGLLATATVTPGGGVTINNVAPTIAPIANATLHWGLVYVGAAVGSDANAACEKLTYAKVSGPAALTVNANTGAISWATTGADICVNPVTVSVTDSCGASAQTSFTICVFNTPPVITCPATTTHIIYGQTASGSVSGSDPDAGPGALNYQLVSFSGPGIVTVNPATGAWSWPTLENNSYIGLFTLCVKVSDGAPACAPCSPANADTCCLTIRVIPTIDVTIEKTHQNETYQGQQKTISIYLDSTIVPGNQMGGYDFLIQYDATALTFLSAAPGALLDAAHCRWEYFTYRVGPNGNCGNSGCPTGFVHLVAIAETNNGANHPLCYGGAAGDPGQLASLTFLVSDNRTFECQYAPIRWVWYDCGDNAISSRTGDSLFISRHVYDYDNPIPIEDPSVPFPSWFGANSTCDTALGDNKPDPIRLIDFQNGGFDIACAESIDARGDLNLNEVANEIADAVLYSRYFVSGLSVFTVNLQGQIAASDVNADGFTLSVADLVYLIRVVVGDAQPYPKVAPEINALLTLGNGSIAIDKEVAAGLVVVEGNVTPVLLAEGMEMIYEFDGTQTRILVWPGELSQNLSNTFVGNFLEVDGEVVYTEFATYDGYPVTTSLHKLPTSFALAQNYPNPFNPSTNISFSLVQKSDYTLTIFNVTGQVVKTFAGTHDAGTYEVTWDAGASASGVYYYKLVAGSFSQTKKMVLLK